MAAGSSNEYPPKRPVKIWIGILSIRSSIPQHDLKEAPLLLTVATGPAEGLKIVLPAERVDLVRGRGLEVGELDPVVIVAVDPVVDRDHLRLQLGKSLEYRALASPGEANTRRETLLTRPRQRVDLGNRGANRRGEAILESFGPVEQVDALHDVAVEHDRAGVDGARLKLVGANLLYLDLLQPVLLRLEPPLRGGGIDDLEAEKLVLGGVELAQHIQEILAHAVVRRGYLGGVQHSDAQRIFQQGQRLTT